jgi:uncharacterized glyoxalase superfamily protein PhnB
MIFRGMQLLRVGEPRRCDSEHSTLWGTSDAIDVRGRGRRGTLPRMKNRTVPVDTVIPHIVYRDLPEAMAWLSRAFGFHERFRYGDGPSGAQMHAGRAFIMVRGVRQLADKTEETPATLGYGTQSLTIFVDDVGGHCTQAKAAGATIVEEPHETVYGEYQYAALDLDGHLWVFSRHAKDLRPEDWGAVSSPE